LHEIVLANKPIKNLIYEYIFGIKKTRKLLANFSRKEK